MGEKKRGGRGEGERWGGGKGGCNRNRQKVIA